MRWRKRSANKPRSGSQNPVQRGPLVPYAPAEDRLGLEIQELLRADRRNGGKWMDYPSRRPDDDDGPELDGYCAPSAAAYLFLKGAELAGIESLIAGGEKAVREAGAAAYAAGLRSFQRTDHRTDTSHWWLERVVRGQPTQIIDLTLSVDDRPSDFPYEQGRGRGFMMTGYKRLAIRAGEIVEQVELARRA